MHCVALHLLPTDPRLPERLREELNDVLVGTASEAIGDLRDAVGGFQTEIDLVQGEIERFAEHYVLEESKGSGPLEVLQRLVEDAREMAQGLEAERDETLVTARRLLTFFGDRRVELERGAGDEAVERFFATIREFVVNLEECWREVMEQPRKLRIEGAVVPGGANSSPAVEISVVEEGRRDSVGTMADEPLSGAESSTTRRSLAGVSVRATPPAVGIGLVEGNRGPVGSTAELRQAHGAGAEDRRRLSSPSSTTGQGKGSRTAGGEAAAVARSLAEEVAAARGRLRPAQSGDALGRRLSALRASNEAVGSSIEAGGGAAVGTPVPDG